MSRIPREQARSEIRKYLKEGWTLTWRSSKEDNPPRKKWLILLTKPLHTSQVEIYSE